MASARSRTLFGRWAVSEKTLTVLTILFFMVVAAVFSLLLSNQSLRLDEAQSLWQSSRTPAKILDIVAHDVHVPLYELILHVWQVIFGDAVTVVRLLSLTFFVLTIPAIYLLGRSTYSRTIGLTAAGLFAISPFMNWYGSEIRMYTLLTLVTVLSQYFFLRIFRRHNISSWLGYFVVCVAGIFTHYFFFLVLFTQGIFFLFKRREFGRFSTVGFIATALGLVAAFTPWALYVIHLGLASATRPLIPKPSSIDVFNTFSQFIFGFQNDHLNSLVISLWPVVVLLGFLSLRKLRHVPTETLYFLLAAVLPIVLAFSLSLVISPFYLSRYLIISLPALYLFLGWILSTYPRRLTQTLTIVLAAGMLVTFGHEVVSPNTPVKENYRQATQYLSAHSNPQDVVIVSAPFTVYPVEYYYTGQAEVTTLPIWDRYTSGPIPGFSEAKLPTEVASLKSQHQMAYLLLSQDQGYQEKIKQYFDNHYPRMTTKEFSPKLTLYVYKLRYDQPVLSALSNES